MEKILSEIFASDETAVESLLNLLEGANPSWCASRPEDVRRWRKAIDDAREAKAEKK